MKKVEERLPGVRRADEDCIQNSSVSVFIVLVVDRPIWRSSKNGLPTVRVVNSTCLLNVPLVRVRRRIFF